ncbi:MAG: pyridoxal-phosphate dependent enzyme [bacterium]
MKNEFNPEKRPFLFQAFPGLAGKVNWTPLGTLPTPVQRMEGLEKELQCEGLFVKRDDISGEEYGGNKLRKLEFAIGDARAKNRRHLITMGALGSNHVLATTLLCCSQNMGTTGIFVPQPVHEYLRANILCNCMKGCEIKYVESNPAALWAILTTYLGKLFKNQKPYFLPPGGSNRPGVLGYVEAAFEIAAQVRKGELPEPEYIFVPVGSGGTLAGLALGLRLCGLMSTAVGVRVFDKTMANEKTVAFLANRALGYLRKRDPQVRAAKLAADEIYMIHDYFGKGYAHYTPEGVRAMEKTKELEGIVLEGTYTGKAMAAFMDFMSMTARKNKTALFINTYNSRPLDHILEQCPGPDVLPPKVREYFNCEPEQPE